MNFTIIEYILIAVIFLFQYKSWRSSLNSIEIYNSAIPNVAAFSLEKISFLMDDLKRLSASEIFENKESLSSRTRYGKLSTVAYAKLRNEKIEKQMIDFGFSHDEAVKVADKWMSENVPLNADIVELSLVKCSVSNETIDSILLAINTYLIRNKGTIADFNLIKDIIQRNTDAIEEEINTTLPIPLYLGLMGTMGGIIIGLFSLPDLNSNEFISGGGVNNLIGGVKIAMIASFIGLLATVHNTSKFKGARRFIETQKNLLYTFLQTELLPILSQDVNTGIFALNRNIEKFGLSFEKQVGKIEELTNKNYETIKYQVDTINFIKQVDVSKMANFNLTVLTELKKNIEAFEKISIFFNQIDAFVENSKQIINRTQDVLGVTERIEDVLSESRELQRFLMKHFSEIENRGIIINDTVGKLDNMIDISLTGLQNHITDRIKAIEEIKIKEEDLMLKSFDDSRSNFNNLRHLETLQKTMSNYSQEDANRQKQITKSLETLSQEMKGMNTTLNKMLKRMESNFIKSTISWFRKKEDEGEKNEN
ncbi:MAG: hypothetical protein MUF58_09075 [Arcicella sp.]|jgi:hypothetical protein|nr:hypothetical protein [Arcicella sp.]